MGAKRVDPAMIRFSASELEIGADAVGRLADMMPPGIDANVMGALIADQVESLAANLATLEAQLDDLAVRARTASARYEADEDMHSADLGRFLDDLEDQDGG
jgi:hypothetical protein